ncbi:MAG: hypothetical protein HQK55_11015 [Deltaproteobacteria bacterium]|nr:hypothetical protein [Deltaproteobacteria bacterium]
MTVSSVSTSNTLSQVDSSQAQQGRKYFQQLAQALQKGDLAGAQKAFAALQAAKPKDQDGNDQVNNDQSGSKGTSSFASDMDNLSKALDSGDLKAAQEAFAKVQQDMKSRPHGGHHPKVEGSSQTSTATVVTGANSNDNSVGTTTDSSTGTSLDADLANADVGQNVDIYT